MAEEKKDNKPEEELKKIDPIELGLEIARHEAWVKHRNISYPNAVEGRLDLSYHDLRGNDLSGNNLQEAIFTGVNLSGCDLSQANLQLANLTDADLRETILKDADLTKTIGLRTEQLAGADLTGARLPDHIKDFEGLKIIDEAAKNAKRLFQIMIAACFFAILTIATTSDVTLLVNSAMHPLPIIGTQMPIKSFLIIIPFILTASFFYFHLYMLRLWDKLSKMPAIFPDGQTLDEKIYPWLVLGMIRSNCKLLRVKLPIFQEFQDFLTIFLGWLLVPSITCYLYFRAHIVRTTWLLTSVWLLTYILLFFGVIFLTYAFYKLRQKRFDLKFNKFDKLEKSELNYFWTYRVFSGIIFAPLIVMFFWHLFADPVSSMRSYLAPNCAETFISAKPQNWKGAEGREDLHLVKGAIIFNRNISYGSFHNSFMVNADLRNSDLNNADLTRADLRGARLDSASLYETNLFLTDLRYVTGLSTDSLKQARNWVFAKYDSAMIQRLGLESYHNKSVEKALMGGFDFINLRMGYASYQNFDFSKASFDSCDLTSGDFTNAKLDSAILTNTNLLGAVFEDADISFADFRGAYAFEDEYLIFFGGEKGLDTSRIKSARNWQFAYYDSTLAISLGLQADHSERLESKDLSNYQFQDVYLTNKEIGEFDFQAASFANSNLTKTIFRTCIFIGTDFSGANLTNAGFHTGTGYSIHASGYDASRHGLRGKPYKTYNNLQDAKFINANLEGANLVGAANLTISQLDSATINSKTILPKYLVDSIRADTSLLNKWPWYRKKKN